jgi:DNA polymerase
MRGKETQAITSYIDWWTDAGLVEAVQDNVCGWRQPPPPANDRPPAQTAPRPHVPQVRLAPQSAPAEPAPQPRLQDLPADLDSFDTWLRDSAHLPGATWSPRRIHPTGPGAAPIMVLADMPDPDDLASGALLSGAVGELFDAMLAAIGRERGTLRLGSVALTRPPGGRWDEASAEALRHIALHHISVARPQRLLLLGQLTCRLLTGEDVAADGTGLRNINHYGVTTAVTAIHHPRLLLTRQALKRGAWTALKMLREPV